ncbi:hypothetical protein AMJ57_00290 [Parcubacteria bacterium SG8_24]|nr:MAG: hypothetical protein AMJ57_00290 [Parcubacteria bacterium SG8_24]
MLEALTTRGLSDEAALEVVAGYDSEKIDGPELAEEFGIITEEYGLPLDQVPEQERRRLLVLYNGLKEGAHTSAQDNIGEVLETAIQERVLDQALARIDALREAMESSASIEQIVERVRDSMHSLDAIARTVEGADPSDRIKEEVFQRFNSIARLKSRAVKPELRRAFNEIFDEFGEFIEGDMVPFRIDQGIRDANLPEGEDMGRERLVPTTVEQAMHEMYGRSPAEVKELKVRNRQEVAAEIIRLAREPYVTLDMLLELHRINNQGIVPKEASRFRTQEEVVAFGMRAGLLGEDVGPEMERLVERANDLIDRDALKGLSTLRYEIEVASLHNDMLDIHPFPDRNGSTSLLFLELMMTRKDYEPPTERADDYYGQLARILGYNPAAVAVVGFEQAKIAHVPGFFQGETISKERKRQYIDEINKAAEHFVQLKLKRGKAETAH